MRRMVTRRTLLSASALTTFVLPAACTTSKATSKPKTLQQVTFVTGPSLGGRDSYAYVAEAKGFFAEEGIECKIEPGQVGDYNENLLRANKAQFTVVDGNGAIIRFAKGTNPNVRVLAPIHQIEPIAIHALADRGYTAPSDLAGLTIGTIPGAIPQLLWPAYAKLAGFRADQTVKWQELSAAQLPPLLLARTLPAIALFVFAKESLRKASGKDITSFVMGDLLPDLYGAVLIAQSDWLQADKNRDLAKRFRGALVRGLQYAVDNPDEAGKILASAVKGADPIAAAAELRLMKLYVSSDPLDATRMAKSAALLKSLQLISGEAPADLGQQMIAQL